MNMKALLAIARYTLIEQIRNRLYLIILFFGGIMLMASLLLGALAPGYSTRVVFDVGLLCLELFGLVTAVFGAVSLVLQEIEQKTIYLILTRPIERSFYILGRYLGLLVAVALTMAAMALLHLLALILDPVSFKAFIKEMSFWTVYPTLVLMSMAKVWVTSAIAVFFSLFATSAVSALVFTGFFWVAGHFSSELAFVIDKTISGPARVVTRLASSVFPNFQYFNFRDTFAIPQFPGFEFMGWAFLYGVAYAAFFLILASFLFSRKEF